MIFHKITLNNMFAYEGEQVFEFSPDSDGKTSSDGEAMVCLILGRNGFGKTSLLRALKLLFLGTDDKSMRQGLGLTRGIYIRGNGTSWSGILNIHSRKKGNCKCSVRVELGSKKSVDFIAERRWDLSGDSSTSADEKLEVEVRSEGNGFLTSLDLDPEEQLNELLPRELVPFFFFDGEEVQDLADASDVSRAEAVERLLGLSFIKGVEKELGELINKWRRDELPTEVQAKIADEEGKLHAAEQHQSAGQERRETSSGQLLELEELAEKLLYKMKNLRQGGAFADVPSLDKRIAELEKELQEKQHDLAYDLAEKAPMIANPKWVLKAICPLRSHVDLMAQTAGSVVSALSGTLPKVLFDEPPLPRNPLTEDQKTFFKERLLKILDIYEVPEQTAEVFLTNVDLEQARTLFEKFAGLKTNIKALREDCARRLRDVSGLKSSLEDRKAERREAEFGSSEPGRQYSEFEREHATAEQNIGKTKSGIERIDHEIETRKVDIQSIENKIRELEKQAGDAKSTNERLKVSVGLRESFCEYRKLRREAKREEIQETLNTHFKRLMSGHALIHEITVDEDFNLRFMDEDAKELGNASISQGMRQLAVTALLWALKDVSGRSLPVVIDTPLARIDRDNQKNLLEHYYPKAADQVIILATDSEIDERKFEIIKPCLTRVFRLANVKGDQATVDEVSGKKVSTLTWKDVSYG